MAKSDHQIQLLRKIEPDSAAKIKDIIIENTEKLLKNSIDETIESAENTEDSESIEDSENEENSKNAENTADTDNLDDIENSDSMDNTTDWNLSSNMNYKVHNSHPDLRMQWELECIKEYPVTVRLTLLQQGMILKINIKTFFLFIIYNFINNRF